MAYTFMTRVSVETKAVVVEKDTTHLRFRGQPALLLLQPQSPNQSNLTTKALMHVLCIQQRVSEEARILVSS